MKIITIHFNRDNYGHALPTTLPMSVHVFSATSLHHVNASPAYHWDFMKTELKGHVTSKIISAVIGHC
jgi:hypothetical protein